MKYIYFILLLTITSTCFAQKLKSNELQKDLEVYLGTYQVKMLPSQKFRVFKDDQKFMLEIVGQGTTELIQVKDDQFKAKYIKPEAIVEFKKGLHDSVLSLIWMQNSRDQHMTRISESETDTSTRNDDPLFPFIGNYKAKGDAYHIFRIRSKNNHLLSKLGDQDPFILEMVSKTEFKITSDQYIATYEFSQNVNGKFNSITLKQHGPVECIKVIDKNIPIQSQKHLFSNRTKFTHADTLMGKLSAIRSCYDVLFYHLDIQVIPETKSIKGSNTIRFSSINDFIEMQVDLFANMKINKILFHDQELSFTREADAVFIKYPSIIKKGSKDEIKVFYEGTPQLLDLRNSASGLIWYQDKNGNPWIETVSQGSGASVWWPCKDHLSDKPDSMLISVTIPKGLTEISNGKLLSRTELPNNLTKFNWFVSYPINNYNAVMYIGDYTHFSDQYINNNDTLLINYYTLAYTKEKANEFFTQVKPMLQLFEQSFGPYPFKNDGFALVEAPYGMEHQGAVSMGSLYNPPNYTTYDSANLTNTLWHETAHEWWGNSVTCKDYADFWIHESFATYAEILSRKTFVGEEAAKTYINNWKPDNKEPIIGFTDVNDFHMGDMYPKGGRMLITLQNLIQNDSLWFSILRTIQEKYKYQTVTTNDIVAVFNEATKTDYNYFFDQYLKNASIPELQIRLSNEGSSLLVQYKWKTDVASFKMPAQITTSKNVFSNIDPTTEWKTIVLNNMQEKDFKVNRDMGYFNVQIGDKTK
jgi:hypothetical protein